MDIRTVSLTLAPILFGMVLAWFVLLKLFFNRLERVHPQTYEEMGRPSLFLRNSPAGVLATFRFLVRREHRALHDSYLSKLSDGMLLYFAVYLAVFLFLLPAVFYQGATDAAAV